MQLKNKPLASAAIGWLAIGAAVGWSAPAPEPIPMGAAPNYRAIVAQNQAAVVGITTEGEVRVSDSQLFGFGGEPDASPPDDQGDDVNPFSRHFHGDNGPHTRIPMHAQGSGFIVSPDGLVLTNAHVVDGSKVVTVKLNDRREFKATVLGADKVTDVAVLKIDAHELPVVRLGNSDQLIVGDYVLAIGAPFGLEETATAGIVSAKARSLPGDGTVPFIQTDAAVNPGNSGGPLFDASGAVVGINSQIYSSSGGNEGVAFAIPINLVEQIKDQIVSTGNVQHGRLGVEVQDVTQSLAESFKLSSPVGALVAEVKPHSAAERAGLRPGDVVLQYNGVTIVNSGELAARVSMVAPGDTASIQIVRDGKPLTLTATIDSATRVAVVSRSAGSQQPGRLGLAVRPLTEEEREQSGADGGLLVEDAHGPAEAAGIEQGDVVLAINGTLVSSVAQLRDLVRPHDKHIALLVLRGDSRLFVPITLG